jgi:hypothetical protein
MNLGRIHRDPALWEIDSLDLGMDVHVILVMPDRTPAIG